jgi:NAD(P)-dependent dehydrogenase (short-subunit alcohol dehydrogenase family)
VSAPGGAVDAVATAVAEFGRPDIFLVNAGVECAVHPVGDFDLVDYERVFGVNVRGVFLSAQAAIAQFLKQGDGGRLLLTASIAAVSGTPGNSVYTASKHAVHGILRSLKGELGPHGIRVNAIAPGAVETDMMRRIESDLGAASGVGAEDIHGSIAATRPLGRYCEPEEVAALAAWLVSDEASYCHGELVTITGGGAP